VSILCCIDVARCDMCLIWVRCQYLKLPLFRFYDCFTMSQVLPNRCRHRQMQTQTDTGTDTCSHRQMQAQTHAVTDTCRYRQDTFCSSFSLVPSKQLTQILIQILEACLLARSLRRVACVQCTHSSEVRWSCGCFQVTRCHIC